MSGFSGLRRTVWNGTIPPRPVSAAEDDRRRSVGEIIAQVRREGDSAVIELTERFGGPRVSSLQVKAEELEKAWDSLPKKYRDALETAAERIAHFHRLQKPKEVVLDFRDGTVVSRRPVPLGAVGLYAPSGSAPLPSSVLMGALPAKIAGCPVVVLASPPGLNGEIAPSVLAAARLCGVDHVFRMGGAQAIAAMAFGTESVPKADKLFGPGNAWVAEAKRQAAGMAGGAAFDLPAGPSEVMVVADRFSDPRYAAADLLSQAEHGPDSQAVLVSFDERTANSVDGELRKQLASLPRRDIAEPALSQSFCVLVKNSAEALAAVEAYAPEHLILLNEDARVFAEGVRAAGAVFIGPYSPEAAGDYAFGANHVLPTFGSARAYSGLGVESFMRWVSVCESSREGLESIADAVEALAELEGLEGHRRAVALRRRAS